MTDTHTTTLDTTLGDAMDTLTRVILQLETARARYETERREMARHRDDDQEDAYDE